jgi:hypothetical protein
MDQILDLAGELARWGALALLAWGAALCLQESLAQGRHAESAAGATPPASH